MNFLLFPSTSLMKKQLENSKATVHKPSSDGIMTIAIMQEGVTLLEWIIPALSKSLTVLSRWASCSLRILKQRTMRVNRLKTRKKLPQQQQLPKIKSPLIGLKSMTKMMMMTIMKSLMLKQTIWKKKFLKNHILTIKLMTLMMMITVTAFWKSTPKSSLFKLI